MRFAGRERELKLLGSRLAGVRSTGTGALVALRGRRRVGKSRLVDEFARRSGVPHVWFPVLVQEWGAGRTREGYLAEALADPTSFLVVSAERALAAELPIASQAREVLGSIGAGSRAHKQLGLDTGFHATGLNAALASLQAKRVIERLTPYSTRSAPRTALWEIVDPYMRFWLRFVNRRIDLIERDRGQVLVEDVERSWPSFRGQAIEHLIRSSVERMLPDPSFGSSTRHVGAYWNRVGTIQVDLVGGDRQSVARELGFIGSVKWRLDAPLGRADALALAAQRALVPGATERTKLIGVSARGFREATALDVRLGPDELLAAWR